MEEWPREVALSAIDDRVDRAQEHLDAIKRELVAYYESDPCRISGYFERQGDGPLRNVRHRFHAAASPLGARLNTLIGEFLHDSRSALNHLARQMVLEHSGKVPRKCAFPVFTSTPASKKDGKQALLNLPGGASMAAREIVHETQPYSWGDRYAHHPIFFLETLWNIDKHRDVLARGGYVEFHIHCQPPAGFLYLSRFESATEYEAKLALIPTDPNVDVNAYATVRVTISEPEMPIEVQLLGTFELILETVKGAVDAAKATCFS